jgi:hypothetical protein
MATQKLNLTRDQLATFLKSHEQIKQFERLFQVVEEISPLTDTEGIQINAEQAQATANTALSLIETISQALALNTGATDQKANEALIKIEQLAQSIEINNAIAQTKAQQALDAVAKLTPMVEWLALAPAPREFKRSRYGAFYDTTTQTAPAINTATPITFNTTNLSKGIYLGTPASRIYVDTQGIYNVQFSIQLDKTTGGVDEFFVWFRQNGVDIPDSCSQVRIQGNNAEVLATVNYFVNMKYNDYMEIVFAVTDTATKITSFPATAFSPSIPGIIVTISNNIEGMI